MSSTDPFNDLTRGGMAGDPSHVPDRGTAQVESRITSGGGGTGNMENRTSRITNETESLADRVTDRAEGLYNEAQDRASEWTDRAGEYATRARGQVNEALDRAEDRLEEQTGAISMIRDYPLAAAGIAFGVGFLLAGSGSSGRSKRSSGVVGKAGGQLRSAVLASVSTMLMQELQEMLDEHGGPMGLFNAVTGRGNQEPQYPR